MERPKMLVTRITRLLEKKGPQCIDEIHAKLKPRPAMATLRTSLVRLANAGRIKRVYNGVYTNIN